MLKFAFIMNVPGTSPDKDFAVFENEESYTLLAETSTYEMTEALVLKLAKDGITIVDLCGDFDDLAVERLTKATNGKVQVRHADYFPDEMAKMDKLPSLKEYGIIIAMDGVQTTQIREILNKECNTYVHFIKDLEGAKTAAKNLLNQGVYFIELCSWFDKEKTQSLIHAVEGKLPIGSCGELS
ncbi:MAG: DUF6506 family protein [Anaerovoracaceae bacterium]